MSFTEFEEALAILGLTMDDLLFSEDDGSDESGIKWPIGQYALPMTSEGCPSDQFSEGTRVETGSAAGECKNKNRRGCNHWYKSYGCDNNVAFMHSECPAKCGICHIFGNHKSDSYHLA